MSSRSNPYYNERVESQDDCYKLYLFSSLLSPQVLQDALFHLTSTVSPMIPPVVRNILGLLNLDENTGLNFAILTANHFILLVYSCVRHFRVFIRS